MRWMSFFLLAAMPYSAAVADEHYFALFFAHQTPDRDAEKAHSYIEFIRAEIQPNAPPILL